MSWLEALGFEMQQVLIILVPKLVAADDRCLLAQAAKDKKAAIRRISRYEREIKNAPG